MNCSCGVTLRQFWIWRDGNGTLHASQFPPSVGSERSVLAATARDALVPMARGGVPRHRVTDVDDPASIWDGRCAAAARRSKMIRVPATHAPASAQ